MNIIGASSRATARGWPSVVPFASVAVILLSAGALTGTGCTTRTSVFDIIDYRAPGRAQRYRETFDEAYYDFDRAGNVDIVLRRCEPSEGDPLEEVIQVIHLHSVWQPIPGQTVAERTQINGTVTYGIVSGRVGATFEGAGSVFFRENRSRNVLEGSLDLASLKPQRRLAAGPDLFKRAELAGEFRARRNSRRVVRIINDLNRRFGPLPAPRQRSSGSTNTSQ